MAKKYGYVYDSKTYSILTGSVAGVAKAIEFGLAKLIGLVINLFAKLIGLGGLSKKVQAIFKKIRKRVDKAVNKILKKARKAGRKLMRKLGIGTKEKPKNKEQHDEQVKAGLMYLDQLSHQEDKDKDGNIDEETANRIAQKTKKKFNVFTSIIPTLESGKWVYDWTGSRGRKKTNLKGFKSQGQLDQFAKEIQAGVAKLGYGHSKIVMQGSSVTGVGYEKPHKPFDEGRKSDLDVGIINNELLIKAEELGIVKPGLGRSFPLDIDNIDRSKLLGLDTLQLKISKRMNREVNFRIYGSSDLAKEGRATQTIKHN